MRRNEGELDAAVFLFRWRRQGDRGGGVRPAGGGAVLGFSAGGRRRPVACWAGQEAEAQWRGEGKLAGWEKKEWVVAGPKAEENYFRIKFGFLNIQRLWKFAHGDLGGILT
jgi:hypothetical protein